MAITLVSRAWAHLPSAAVVAAILADVQARPTKWAIASGLADSARSRQALTDAWNAALLSGNLCIDLGTSWSAAPQSSAGKTAGAARGTIYGILAWPESAKLLDLTPDALRTIINSCEGDLKYQAVLLLPAVIVPTIHHTDWRLKE